jgi:hypothetical protein
MMQKVVSILFIAGTDQWKQDTSVAVYVQREWIAERNDNPQYLVKCAVIKLKLISAFIVLFYVLDYNFVIKLQYLAILTKHET